VERGDDVVAPELRHWIEVVSEVRSPTFSRPDPVGRSRDIWLVISEDDSGVPVEYVARRETGRGTFAGTAFTLRREASVLAALAGTGLPAPRLHGVSDDGNIILIQRMAGTAEFEFDDEGVRSRTIDNFIRVVARLHEVDLAPFAEALEVPQTVADHALLDLQHYRDAFDEFGQGEPVVERALDWLQQHVPTTVQRTAMLQGDTGPGNFLHLDGEITGLIDWEMAHIGDPMDDLAWMWFRKRFLRADEDLADWYRRYAEESGVAVDYASVCYYRVAVLLRSAVATIVRRAHNPGVVDPKPARMGALLEAVLRDPYDEGGVLDALPPILTPAERELAGAIT
jgi:aminoglycoside phosphotransferase (APT) family kinase protein